MENLEKTLHGMSIYVRRAWDAVMPVGWEIPTRYIYDYELLYVKQGELVIDIEGQVFKGEPGDLFFFSPGKMHSIRSEGAEGVRQPHIHFDFFFDEESEQLEIPIRMPRSKGKIRKDIGQENLLLQIPSKMTFKNPYEIETLIQNIIIEHSDNNPFSIIRTKSLMFQLLYLIFNYQYIDRDGNGEANALNIVQKANNFMQRCYNRNLTTAEIAREVGYSVTYFVSLYKSICFVTPIKYHEKLRIERAKNLFLSTSLTVSEVAENLGFKTLYDFSRYFKRATGTSPSEFRTINRE